MLGRCIILPLVERRDGHNEAEVADLEKVVEQYPQSRDARRELGVSYYQLDRSEDAVKQFKALQAIDPDDLAAHYNLAILYRRLGMLDQAKTEAAMYADKKADPHAQALALDFLSEHPQVSRESIPQHIYTNMAHPPISSGDQQ